MPTKILPCECEHDYQDKKYGKRMRVFNETAKVNPTIYRCTICEKEKSRGGNTNVK